MLSSEVQHRCSLTWLSYSFQAVTVARKDASDWFLISATDWFSCLPCSRRLARRDAFTSCKYAAWIALVNSSARLGQTLSNTLGQGLSPSLCIEIKGQFDSQRYMGRGRERSQRY